MQFVTIFFPIYEAYKSRSHLRATLELIKSWEKKRQHDESTITSSVSSSRHRSYFSTSTKSVTTTTRSVRSREKHTMAALEKALLVNPIPLLHFAVTRDFTGENIVFLIQVRDFHATWNRVSSDDNELTDEERSHMFEVALEIYVSSVHQKTTEFPINIEHKIRRELDNVFETAASQRRPYRDDSIVDKDKSMDDPFRSHSLGMVLPRNVRGILERADSDETDGTFNNDIREDIFPSRKEFVFEANPCVRLPVRRNEAANIMTGFDEHVFDEAEESIKYLVLTNTWQKFVMEHNAISP
jgi:hypothetical protein